MPLSLYFEDLEIGQEFTSPARTITESDIMQFAGLSGDYNPLHTDDVFAAGTPFGRRIAHGLLGLSIASGLIARTGIFDRTAIAMLGVDGWKFTAPIFIGDTVHVKIKITGKRESSKGNQGIIMREIQLIN